MKALAQVFAIAQVESRLLWRGRVIRVIVGALLALIVIQALIAGDSSTALLATGLVDQASIAEGLGRTATFLSWSTLGVTLALLLPLLVADSIPKDGLLEVRELLDSLPLPLWVYLTGKVLGVILGFGLAVGIVLIIGAGLWRIKLGEFSWTPYLEMAVFGALALVIINGGIGVLLTATQRTRRRAVGLVLFGLLILPFVFGGDHTFSDPNLLGMASPLRGPLITYFLYTNITQQQLVTTLVLGLVELITLAVIVWGGITWHNKRI